MHEFAIAAGILDVVRAYVPPADGRRVRSVRVRVGDVAGVATEALDFCFEAVAGETPYAGAWLEFDHVEGDDLQVVDVELDDDVGEVVA